MRRVSRTNPGVVRLLATRSCQPLRRGRACDERGQAALEYLLVGLVLLAMIVALGALWRFIADDGMSHVLVDHSSHALQQPGGVVDALMF